MTMRDPDPLAQLAASLSDGADFLSTLNGPFRRSFRLHPRRGTPAGWGALGVMAFSAEAVRQHDAGRSWWRAIPRSRANWT